VIQLWKILKKKDAHHSLEHPEELTKKFEQKLDDIQKMQKPASEKK
jgi:hypothetical protein